MSRTFTVHSVAGGAFVIALAVLYFMDIAAYWVMAMAFCLPILIGLGIAGDPTRRRAGWANWLFLVAGLLGVGLAAFGLLDQYFGPIPEYVGPTSIPVENVRGMACGMILGIFLALILSGELCGKEVSLTEGPDANHDEKDASNK